MNNHDLLQDCLEACWACAHECRTTLYQHCLSMGDDHVGQSHVKIMTDCIQICQTTADFLDRQSDLHVAVCEACAEICGACAESCETIDSPHMRDCAVVCRSCAESCRTMTKNYPADMSLGSLAESVAV